MPRSVKVWLAEADKCMISKAFDLLGGIGGPLTSSQIKLVLSEVTPEWFSCGDTEDHVLERIPKSHVQLLWLLGACRDSGTGQPLIAPDGHLVCFPSSFTKIKEDLRARKDRIANSGSDKFYKRKDSLEQKKQAQKQRKDTFEFETAKSKKKVGAVAIAMKRIEKYVRDQQKRLQHADVMLQEVYVHLSDRVKDFKLNNLSMPNHQVAKDVSDIIKNKKSEDLKKYLTLNIHNSAQQ
jgi:hypothetical protein